MPKLNASHVMGPGLFVMFAENRVNREWINVRIAPKEKPFGARRRGEMSRSPEILHEELRNRLDQIIRLLERLLKIKEALRDRKKAP